MERRRFLAVGGGGALAMLAGVGSAQPVTGGLGHDHPLLPAWQAWKALCLLPEGRVVDGFQNSASHSEGQGYGLTLAAMFGDMAACESIIDWTETHLALRGDALLAWRWRPDTVPAVSDRNNASDGDLFYAWGLALAAQQVPRPEWTERAAQIGRDLLAFCTAPWPDDSGRQLLLPGVSGFLSPAGPIINPSYYMPRAMRELATLTSLPALATLAEVGGHLIDQLAQRALVPDWVTVTAEGFSPPPEQFPAYSGYEAMRVPLFALWSGAERSPAVAGYASAMMAGGVAAAGGTPTVFDPYSFAVRERSTHPGYAALAALSNCVTAAELGSLMPPFSTDQPYYPATLHLMALVAQATWYPRCVPI